MDSFLTRQNLLLLGNYKYKQKSGRLAPCATGSLRATQQKICVENGENIMLERIRTFFGRTKNKTNIVEQGSAWYCTDCKLVFLTKHSGEQHSCEYRFQNSVVEMKKDAKTKE
jgi:hypothetical protein